MGSEALGEALARAAEASLRGVVAGQAGKRPQIAYLLFAEQSCELVLVRLAHLGSAKCTVAVVRLIVCASSPLPMATVPCSTSVPETGVRVTSENGARCRAETIR